MKKVKAKNIPPIVCVVGLSDSGKTTILVKLISEFTGRGFKVGSIKHAAHGFTMDQAGKDSWRHKEAGAAITMSASPGQIGMIMDVDHDYHPDELAPFFRGMDIILVEGYKHKDKPKIEVFDPRVGKEPILKDDRHLIALMCDVPIDSDVPRFLRDDVEGLVNFLIDFLDLDITFSTQPRKKVL